MSDALHVLLVEDLPTDAELNKREVETVLPNSTFLCVETREEYLAALTSFSPDLILSDYTLPRFDGLSALKLAIEYAPDIPFIIVTGSINEDTAVGCMKAGAWDYIIKGQFKRIGLAILNGLEQAHLRKERRIAEQKMVEKAHELERSNNLMIGRELKMIDLKKEINALLLRLGEKEKYRIVAQEGLKSP